MQRWLAREQARNDKTLIGFWPLFANTLNYTSEGRHHGYTAHYNADRRFYKPFNIYGKQGHAFDTDTLVIVPDQTNLYNFDVRDKFTICFWVYLDPTYDNFGNAISHMSGDKGYNFAISTTGLSFHFWDDSTHQISKTLRIYHVYPGNSILGRWIHIGFKYTGIPQTSSSPLLSAFHFYFNGREVVIDYSDIDTWSIPSTASVPGTPLKIGDTLGLAGMNLVRIWNREISNAELSSVYYRELDLFRPRTVARSWLNNSNNCTLFICGEMSLYGSIPLFEGGVGLSQKGLNLNVACQTNLAAPNQLTLYLAGSSPGTNGMFSAIPLFVSGVAYSRQLNLFLNGTDRATVTRNMNMSIHGSAYSLEAYTPLIVANNSLGVNKSIPLNVNGSGNPNPLTPGMPVGHSLNLYLRRQPSSMVPLFLSASSPAQASAPLYVKGAGVSTGSTTLVMPDTKAEYHQSAPLFVSGF
jgi:hypothetical protein